MKTYRFTISERMARQKDIPVSFVAVVLRETPKAIYVYGHGELHPKGRCSRCGRTLTHPGSILIGIGPECLGSWGTRDDRLENLGEEDIRVLRALVTEREVDTWLPKYCVKSQEEWAEEITPPTNHKLLSNRPTQKREAVLENASTIKITFPFNREDLANVKTLPGRRFHNNGSKYWTCPLSVDAVEALKYWGFPLDPALEEFLKKSKISVDDVVEIDIPGLKGELYPFQHKGVSFIEAKDGRALIGDEMGLGKTVQALAYLQLHPEKRPAVIVVPASLKLNWEKEARAWMPDPKVEVLSGKKTYEITGEIIIINYDILTAWVGQLQQLEPQVLIIDEIHYTKNNQAKRTKACKALAKNIPHVIGLSGTPIVNRPIEAFNALKMINSTVVPSFWQYAHKYCGAVHNHFGWDFSGATNTEELHQKLTQTIMLRRLKKDVLTDLPEKQYSFLPVELTNEKEYRKAEVDFIQWLKETRGKEAAQKAKNAETLVKIEALKQLAVKGKMKHAIEWIRDFLEVDGKLVVFATHKATINALMDEFKDKAVKVDGSVTGPDREKAVEEFQNNPNIRLFIGNIRAAGVGITLTAASSVAFLELPWTPGELSQAEDRCHRIGQKDSVMVYHLLAQDTIEGRIAEMLDRKRKVLDSVLDGKETEQESLLTQLINSYKEE